MSGARIGYFGWSGSSIEERTFASLEEALARADQDRACWIDIEGVAPADFVAAAERALRLVPLAADTLVEGVRRPGVDLFEDVIVVTMRSHLPDESTEFIDLIVNDRMVITLQERSGGDPFDGVRQKLRASADRLSRADVNVVFLLLARAICDGFRPVLERYQESLERFERVLVRRPESSMLDRVHHHRRQLLFLRQGLAPLREALANLQNALPIREAETPAMRSRLTALRELQDEVGALLDVVEFQKDSSQHLLDLYLNAASNRLNEIVRVLTIISVIFMPMTLIAGIYGMNFEGSSEFAMPELRWKYGYPFALGLMAFTAISLLYFFWRRGWIGDPLRRRRNSSVIPGLPETLQGAWPLNAILSRRRKPHRGKTG
ncbi:MAG: magnesium/cobalt transporter CorA [Planctomycetota bacterium]